MRSVVLLSVICGVASMGMAGCPPQPPGPPVVDSGVSDVAPPPPPPPPVMDSSPPVPTADSAPLPPPVVDAAPPSTDPCVNACTQMNSVGCGQQADCAKVLGLVQANRTNRNLKNGKPLTCNDLLGVKSSADVKAIGWNCK